MRNGIRSIMRFAPSTFKWGNGASWSYGDELRMRRGLGRTASSTEKVFRIVAVITLFLLVVYGPWWLTIVLATLFFFAFPFPVEALLAIFFMDSVSGGYVYVLGALVLMPLLTWLTDRMRISH